MNSNKRISAAFEQAGSRSALIPYITAGDPSPAASPRLMHALVAAGADIIELGVPFSDPMADGSVIQLAAERAIRQGTSLQRVLDIVAEFRQDDGTTPVVLMGYANPIERMGQAVFAEKAAAAGVDGMLVVDYPPEEATEYADLLMSHGLDPIFLLAPTSTPDRMAQVGKIARGYVYYVSLKGVTGSGSLDTQDVEKRVARIREHVSIPVGVGFGIRDADSARQLGQCADAVVIGSKLIETMHQAAQAAVAAGQTSAQADQAAIDTAAAWLAEIRNSL